MGDETQPQQSFAELAYQNIAEGEAAEAAESTTENEQIGEDFVKSEEGAAAEEETETEEDTEDAGESEESEEDEGDESEEEEEEAVDLLADDGLVEVGDEQITLAELKERAEKGGMRQSDYTKKTMEVAAEKKAIVAEREKHKAASEGVSKWWDRMKTDGKFMRQVLENEAPEIMDQLVIARAQELYEESQLPEGEQSARAELRQRDRDKAKTDAEVERLRKDQTTRESNAADVERNANWAKWVPSALQAAGLEEKGNDKHNNEMCGLVQVRMSKDYGHVLEEWTAEQMVRAAKDTASMLDRVAGKRVAGLNPDEVAKTLGPKAMAKLRKAEAAKARGGGKVAKKPAGDPGNGKKPRRAAPKPKNLDESWDALRQKFMT